MTLSTKSHPLGHPIELITTQKISRVRSFHACSLCILLSSLTGKGTAPNELSINQEKRVRACVCEAALHWLRARAARASPPPRDPPVLPAGIYRLALCLAASSPVHSVLTTSTPQRPLYTLLTHTRSQRQKPTHSPIAFNFEQMCIKKIINSYAVSLEFLHSRTLKDKK